MEKAKAPTKPVSLSINKNTLCTGCSRTLPRSTKLDSTAIKFPSPTPKIGFFINMRPAVIDSPRRSIVSFCKYKSLSKTKLANIGVVKLNNKNVKNKNT